MWPFHHGPKRVVVHSYRDMASWTLSRQMERDAEKMARKGYRVAGTNITRSGWSGYRAFATFELIDRR